MQKSLTNKLLRLPGFVKGRIRVATLRMAGAYIGKGCWIRDIDVPCDPWDVWLEDGVSLDNQVVLCLNGPLRRRQSRRSWFTAERTSTGSPCSTPSIASRSAATA